MLVAMKALGLLAIAATASADPGDHTLPRRYHAMSETTEETIRLTIGYAHPELLEVHGHPLGGATIAWTLVYDGAELLIETVTRGDDTTFAATKTSPARVDRTRLIGAARARVLAGAPAGAIVRLVEQPTRVHWTPIGGDVGYSVITGWRVGYAVTVDGRDVFVDAYPARKR